VHAFSNAILDVLDLIRECLALGFQLLRGYSDGLDTMPVKVFDTDSVCPQIMLYSVYLHDEEGLGQIEIDLLVAVFLGVDLGYVIDWNLRHEELHHKGILLQEFREKFLMEAPGRIVIPLIVSPNGVPPPGVIGADQRIADFIMVLFLVDCPKVTLEEF